MASRQIVPHFETKGVDVCGFNKKKVIIRSDIGVYIETDTFRPTSETDKVHEVVVRLLHPKCMNGDHYIATDREDDQDNAYSGVFGWLASFIPTGLKFQVNPMPAIAHASGASTGAAVSQCVSAVLPPKPKPTSEFFYIVHGKEFSRVTDLTCNSNVSYFKLHPDCQGGRFYLANTILDVEGIQTTYHNYFYIIFDDNTCLRVPTMCKKEYVSEKSVQFKLHKECRNGLYYFGTKGFFFIVKQIHPQWGLQYHKTTDLKTDANCETVDIRGSVANFIPGGLALSIGSVSGKWSFIQKICNTDSSAEPVQSIVINRKVGFEKESCLKILSTDTLDEDQALSLLKAQFSLSPSFGGCGENCSDKGWCTEIVKKEEFHIQPGNSVYIWQYVHCVGKHNILYHQETAITNSKSDVPPIPNSASVNTPCSHNAAEPIQTSQDFKSKAAKPNLSNLTLIKWKDKTGDTKDFRLNRSIYHRWKKVGALVVSRQDLDVWSRNKDDLESCNAVLSHWLDNPPDCYPATWEGLYKLLKDSELSEIGDELKEAIDNAI